MECINKVADIIHTGQMCDVFGVYMNGQFAAYYFILLGKIFK